MKNIATVNKEYLSTVQFSQEEVVPDATEQIKRSINLYRAMLLGNTERCKVNIIFKSQNNTLHQVETTIWAVLEDYIILKGGKSIPIRAIKEIEF